MSHDSKANLFCTKNPFNQAAASTQKLWPLAYKYIGKIPKYQIQNKITRKWMQHNLTRPGESFLEPCKSYNEVKRDDEEAEMPKDRSCPIRETALEEGDSV